MIKTSLHLCLLLLFTCSACEKRNLKNAEKSLMGSWEVQAIYSTYGNKTDLGIQTNEEFIEEGSLGQFMFKDESVSYNFTRLDTLLLLVMKLVMPKKMLLKLACFMKLKLPELTLLLN